MRNIWTIAKREYNNYFNSPLAYVIAAGLLFILGVVFILILSNANDPYSFGQAPEIADINGLFAFLLLLIVPALTMRLISDETRSGTLELMLTAPVRDFELVTGKWLGSMLFMLTIIAITLIFPIIANSLIDPGIDQVKMMSSYLGLILVTGAMLALGTGVSALFNNQLAAFLVTLLGVLLPLWWLIGFLEMLMPSGGELFRYILINTHFDSTLNVGDIYLKDVVYFLSLIAVGLFTGTVAVSSRRWR